MLTAKVECDHENGSGKANLVYKRIRPTSSQPTVNLVMDEAGIGDLVVFEEQAGTPSRLQSLEQPKFRELLAYTRGDTVHISEHISEMFRLVRGTGHILDAPEVLHRDRLALRIHDGAFSPMDLTTRHPRTGELLYTVKFMVQTLAAAGELQRDLQQELTYYERTRRHAYYSAVMFSPMRCQENDEGWKPEVLARFYAYSKTVSYVVRRSSRL
ncbi:hypothetical protein [Streptomyces collinus]|uniref:hypothetical protein n=1 Tax=Streptomyces collinus TaxID=42684 RepID=UPI0036EBEF7E